MSDFEVKVTPDGRKWDATVKELNKLAVAIGYQSGEAFEEDENGNSVDVCQIAVWNEFGTNRGIPSRPFMRDTVDKHEAEWNNALKKYANMAVGGMSGKQVMEQLGLYGVRAVQSEIKNGDFAPNAPRTVRMKKSDKPLIDTGRMRQSVNYYVKPKGELK